jgi:DNA-binding winged helix-turn-helix (wHTH) protein
MAKYLFGNHLLDVDERRLLRDNEEIRLRGKLFDTLRVLVE